MERTFTIQESTLNGRRVVGDLILLADLQEKGRREVDLNAMSVVIEVISPEIAGVVRMAGEEVLEVPEEDTAEVEARADLLEETGAGAGAEREAETEITRTGAEREVETEIIRTGAETEITRTGAGREITRTGAETKITRTGAEREKGVVAEKKKGNENETGVETGMTIRTKIETKKEMSKEIVMVMIESLRVKAIITITTRITIATTLMISL